MKVTKAHIETARQEIKNSRYDGRMSINSARLLNDLLNQKEIGKMYKKHNFKHSARASKLANLIYDQFGLVLESKIHRRYSNNEDIKFEMRTVDGKFYFFEGLVKEFLEADTTMVMVADTFIIT